MWICKNCNQVNQGDGETTCSTCNTGRDVVVDAKGKARSWSCMSCGKINSVKIMKCPVCNASRFSREAGQTAYVASDPPGTAEILRTATLDAIERLGRRNLIYGMLGLCFATLGVFFWMNRHPSEIAVKAGFETTELPRINAAFVGNRIDNTESTQSAPARDLKVVSAMIQRLALDCRERMPSTVLLEKTRENNGPEDFKSDLFKLAGAVDRYLDDKTGPFGDGYSLKSIKVTRSQKSRTDDGTPICTIEYDATLTALGDVMVYRPQYLEGQEYTPLAENNTVNLDNFDRFYKAYLDRDADGSHAAAAEFNRKRGNRIYSKGESHVITGKMIFIRTDSGWKRSGSAEGPAG